MRLALEIDSLRVEVCRDRIWQEAVRGVSLAIAPGGRVAMVGESGSGKSLTALAIGRLLGPTARIGDGRICVAGAEITRSRPRDVATRLGSDIGFVFQDPSAALDPTLPIGRQVGEALEGTVPKRERQERVIELLTRVGIANARNRLDDYPHQFSGGMRQRAVIAAALINRPQLLVADEPTSALDVTVQAQVLELLNELNDELGVAILFITHDLAVARVIADRVCVMYAGIIVEEGPANKLLHTPDHPYSRALLNLAPRLHGADELPQPIPGNPLPGWLAGPGCPFAPRCRFAIELCRSAPAVLAARSDVTHRSACIRAGELKQGV